MCIYTLDFSYLLPICASHVNKSVLNQERVNCDCFNVRRSANCFSAYFASLGVNT